MTVLAKELPAGTGRQHRFQCCVGKIFSQRRTVTVSSTAPPDEHDQIRYGCSLADGLFDFIFFICHRCNTGNLHFRIVAHQLLHDGSTIGIKDDTRFDFIAGGNNRRRINHDEATFPGHSSRGHAGEYG